ncbi:MAG: hypothetical protein ACFHXK_17455 [bacterium]
MEQDSLQADVMRFMAIIAFCLIAILAMVRNSPGGETVIASQSAVRPPVNASSSKPAPPAPAPAALPERVPVPEPIPEPVLVSAPVPETLPEPAPETASAPEIVAVPESVAASETVPALEKMPEHRDTRNRPAEGLTLAFASQADFMRLISRGRITLYAYTGQSFLTTTDTYSFRTTRPPRQLYEIDIQTIPAHVIDAAAGQNLVNLQWGVGLSPRIEKQITRYVQANVSGQLHIDRYEQVLHVEAG